MTLVLVACDGGDPSGRSAQTPATTPPRSVAPDPSTPSPGSSDAALTRCDNPEGFTIGYPEDWHTNPGDVVPPCSQFHPEPFEVPEATDERVAGITAFIDPVPLDRAAAPNDRRMIDRNEMRIDGHEAVRLEYETGSEGLWPEGTPITIYMIEAPPSDNGREQTLFIDTIALETFDYERNQEILDRIAPTLTWTSEG